MKNQTRKLTLAALCIAIGVILPQAFHAVPNAGSIYAPMHIAVLLSGFVSGPLYGAIVGALTPFLSFLLTGMPNAANVGSMIFELAVYGLMTGLLYQKLKIKKPFNVYVSLILAMITGRVVGGLVKGLIFNAGSYTIQAWATAYFVTGLPGIIIHIIVVPLAVFALQKAKIID